VIATVATVDPSAAARRASWLLLAEGAALLVVGVVDGVATVLGEPDDRAASLGVAAFAVAGGALLGVLGRAVGRGRGWARTPALVLQLLAFPVATGLAQGGVWIAAVPLFLLAGATSYHLVAARLGE
jgi:hypothetical protein